MKAVRIFSSVAALALIASVALAQDTPPPAGGASGTGRGRGQFSMVDMLKRRISDLKLSADDQAKVDAVFKDYEPKVTEAQKALTTVTTEMREKVMEQLSPEMKTKLQESMNRAGGRNGGRRGGGNGGGGTPAPKPEA